MASLVDSTNNEWRNDYNSTEIPLEKWKETVILSSLYETTIYFFKSLRCYKKAADIMNVEEKNSKQRH